MNGHDTLLRLRAENEALKERLRQIEDGLRDRACFPHHWKLTKKHTMILNILVSRQMATHDSLQTVCGCSYDVMKKHVCGLRARLRPYGIEVGTVYYEGYYLTPAMKEKVRNAR
jgi:hypothetical protein